MTAYTIFGISGLTVVFISCLPFICSELQTIFSLVYFCTSLIVKISIKIKKKKEEKERKKKGTGKGRGRRKRGGEGEEERRRKVI